MKNANKHKNKDLIQITPNIVNRYGEKESLCDQGAIEVEPTFPCSLFFSFRWKASGFL